jgi:hypothetical protein
MNPSTTCPMWYEDLILSGEICSILTFSPWPRIFAKTSRRQASTRQSRHYRVLRTAAGAIHATYLHDRIVMAETLDHDPPASIEEPDEPLPNAPTEDSPAERNAREATELTHVNNLRHNRSPASSSSHQPGSSTAVKKPTTFLERFIYGVTKFWRHQVSITVPHDTCRDHLGTSRKHFCAVQHPPNEPDSALWLFPLWDRSCTSDSPLMQPVMWYFFTTTFQRRIVSFTSQGL